MYLHIGNKKNIRKKQLIGIFDTDNATVSEITRKFLKTREKEGRVDSAVNEIPKSFVLYNGLSGDSYRKAGCRKEINGEKKISEICFSQISSTSLTGRLESKE